MLPLMLDISSVPIAVIGGGFAADMRLNLLFESGAGAVDVYVPDPSKDLSKFGVRHIFSRWPTASDFEAGEYKIVYVSDVELTAAETYADMAHAIGALVNVHDVKALCDFHVPARLVRGDLQVTVSTNGKAAGLARVLRDHLARSVFGPDWASRVSQMAKARDKWRQEGASFQQLVDRTEMFISDRHWLSPPQTTRRSGPEG